MDSLFAAFVAMATWTSLFHVAWATLLGIIVGSLPGLTATMGRGTADHADLFAGS